jgi:hypothetical protein
MQVKINFHFYHKFDSLLQIPLIRIQKTGTKKSEEVYLKTTKENSSVKTDRREECPEAADLPQKSGNLILISIDPRSADTKNQDRRDLPIRRGLFLSEADPISQNQNKI